MVNERQEIKRLFVGSYLSADQQKLLSGLKSQHDRLSGDWQRKIRWVKACKLHMTWLFLGGTEIKDLDPIQDKLALIAKNHRHSQIVYNRAEFWPKPSRARSLVLAAEALPREVEHLARDIRQQLSPYVEKPDYDFRPHITLLRLEPGRGSLTIPDYWPLDKTIPLPMLLKEITLIESDHGKNGDEYVVLKTFPLKS